MQPDDLLNEQYSQTPISPGMVLSGYGTQAAPAANPYHGMDLVNRAQQEQQAAREEAWRRNWVGRALIGDKGRAALNKFLEDPQVSAATGFVPGPNGVGMGVMGGPLMRRWSPQMAERATDLHAQGASPEAIRSETGLTLVGPPAPNRQNPPWTREVPGIPSWAVKPEAGLVGTADKLIHWPELWDEMPWLGRTKIRMMEGPDAGFGSSHPSFGASYSRRNLNTAMPEIKMGVGPNPKTVDAFLPGQEQYGLPGVLMGRAVHELTHGSQLAHGFPFGAQTADRPNWSQLPEYIQRYPKVRGAQQEFERLLAEFESRYGPVKKPLSIPEIYARHGDAGIEAMKPISAKAEQIGEMLQMEPYMNVSGENWARAMQGRWHLPWEEKLGRPIAMDFARPESAHTYNWAPSELFGAGAQAVNRPPGMLRRPRKLQPNPAWDEREAALRNAELAAKARYQMENFDELPPAERAKQRGEKN